MGQAPTVRAIERIRPSGVHTLTSVEDGHAGEGTLAVGTASESILVPLYRIRETSLTQVDRGDSVLVKESDGVMSAWVKHLRIGDIPTQYRAAVRGRYRTGFLSERSLSPLSAEVTLHRSPG